MHRIAVLTGSLALLAAPLAAQTVRGRVVDARTGEGVPQAAVSALTDGGRRAGQARTGADGKFSLPVRAPGTLRLRVERTGYRETLTDTMPVAAQETIDVEVSVSAAALTIAPLRVTARVEPPRRRSLELNGFYDREKRGFGRFLRREQIERHGDYNLANALTRVPGVHIRYVRVKQYIYFRRYRCTPHVYLDGVRMIVNGGQDINSVVSTFQVEAIEVYQSPVEIPAEYNVGRTCGAILIWTKHEA
jgi:hypothetical protein